MAGQLKVFTVPLLHLPANLYFEETARVAFPSLVLLLHSATSSQIAKWFRLGAGWTIHESFLSLLFSAPLFSHRCTARYWHAVCPTVRLDAFVGIFRHISCSTTSSSTLDGVQSAILFVLPSGQRRQPTGQELTTISLPGSRPTPTPCRIFLSNSPKLMPHPTVAAYPSGGGVRVARKRLKVELPAWPGV